jgi:hypothetical protein
MAVRIELAPRLDLASSPALPTTPASSSPR